MNLGKIIRLKRLFSHPSGRFCSIAVDHLLGYGQDMPAGLLHIKPSLAAIMAAKPDALTMHKGMAASIWPQYAGQVPLIIQGSGIKTDDTAQEMFATPEDAIRLGADAFAVAAFIRGKTEGLMLRAVADSVRDALRFEIPVICHIYPRVWDANGNVSISYKPEDIAWAARCAVEVGADVVKTPYCGDIAAHRQIVEDCPVPMVAAGGPKTNTLEEALQQMWEVVEAGALGATIGRNVWGFSNITGNVEAFKAVIHDRLTPAEAMARVAQMA
jgi:fructose-bisphosphate aldolase, class I